MFKNIKVFIRFVRSLFSAQRTESKEIKAQLEKLNIELMSVGIHGGMEGTLPGGQHGYGCDCYSCHSQGEVYPGSYEKTPEPVVECVVFEPDPFSHN